MKRTGFFSVLLSFSLLITADVSTGSAAFKRVEIGETAPGFTLTDLEGSQIALETYKESPLTLVVFWGLWSPNSAPLLKDVQKLVNEFADKGLSAIAVNIDGKDKEGAGADPTEKIRQLVDENEIKLPVLVDLEQEVYAAWGVLVSPTTAFLGKDLILIDEFSGYSRGTYKNVREKIMELLEVEEEVAAVEKPARERFKAPKAVMRNYGMAKVQYDRGQFSKAARKIEKVIDECPDFPDAHALKGAIELGRGAEGKAGSAEKAQAYFQKAVELDETLPMGLAGMAYFEAEGGNVEKAVELVGKAVEFSDKSELPSLPPVNEQDADEGNKNSPADYIDKIVQSLEAGDRENANSRIKFLAQELLGLKKGPALKAKGLAVKELRNQKSAENEKESDEP